MKRRLPIAFFLLLFSTLLAGPAEATGTLTVTFKYTDSNNVQQPLAYAYVYLHNAAEGPPMEKIFTPPDFILGPSDANGRISASVSAGTYYIRITRRKNLGSAARPLGPPEAGDYTWTQLTTVTITDGSVTDLGTKYASFFKPAITITGTIKDDKGNPLAGRYVRAQTDPCISASYGPYNPDQHGPNRCGPVKYLALERTDANGKYLMNLKTAGTYYIYESQCLGDQHQEYVGNPVCVGTNGGTVTVNPGDNKTMNIVVYPPYY